MLPHRGGQVILSVNACRRKKQMLMTMVPCIVIAAWKITTAALSAVALYMQMMWSSIKIVFTASVVLSRCHE